MSDRNVYQPTSLNFDFHLIFVVIVRTRNHGLRSVENRRQLFLPIIQVRICKKSVFGYKRTTTLRFRIDAVQVRFCRDSQAKLLSPDVFLDELPLVVESHFPSRRCSCCRKSADYHWHESCSKR